MTISITVTSADGDRVSQLSVEPHQRVGAIALRLQEEFGIAAANQVLLHDGNPIRFDLTFEGAGVKDNDLVVVMANSSRDSVPPQLPPAASPFALAPPPLVARAGMRIADIPPNASPEMLLDIIDKNPHLLPQIKEGNPKLGQALESKSVSDVRMVLLEMHMEAASKTFQEQEEIMALERNPFDADAQAKIEERIRLSNVQKNMEIAIEEMPEAFARVYMLYIPCEVNGTPVKAFVDSGAQSTIMSSSCAERCGIMRLVDKRFAGQAVGVGTATIIGRVHMAPLKIGNFFYNCSFTILDQQGVDFLFGLDMLKRHQCCIDLQKNVLRLQDASGGHEVPFLPENEIPASERSDPATAVGGSSAVPSSPSPSIATDALAQSLPSTQAPTTSISSVGETTDDKVQRLVALGFDPQRVCYSAAAALASTNGNVELAAGLLFETMG